MIMPYIQVIFRISASSNTFNPEKISRRLAIQPTRTCREADFPPHAIAQTSWSLEITEENTFSVSQVVGKLIRQLAGENAFEKVDTICTLCQELGANPRFDIMIHMQSGDGPEIVLHPRQVLFAAAIGAEIHFDLHCHP